MKNLTTRKILLGVLMTLVLAFGVQGIAKAIENPNAGDIATETIIDPMVVNVGGSDEIDSIDLTFDKAGTIETVRISRTSGITLTGDFYGLSSVTLTENEDTTLDPRKNGNGFTYTRDGRTQTLSGAATGPIGITFTAKGIQSVTISGRDYDGDSGGSAGSWSQRHTFYVMGPGTSTTTISLLGLRNGYKTGIFPGATHRERIHTGDGGHYAVTYTTTPKARAQIENTEGALDSLIDIDGMKTSSALDVLLQVNQTYQVTAQVDNSDRETIGVYIIGTPTLTVGHPGDPNGDGTLGDAVEGSKGIPGRIDDTLPANPSPNNRAFTATVKDGANSAVPGVVVTFRADGSGTGGGRLVFNSSNKNNEGILVDSSNRLKLDSNGNQLTAATDKILYVRTNADGQADVDFQLGTDRKQDVTISAVGQSKVVSAYAGDAVGNQLVNPESKSSQVFGHSGEYELRVEVEDEDGEAVPGEYIEFRTHDGTLENPGTGETDKNLGRLGVQTDTQGIAFVFFDPKDGSGAPRVTAHLLDLGTDNQPGGPGDAADRVIDDVVFNVGGPAQRDDQPSPTPTNRLAISPTSITGDSGDTETVTVTALNVNNAAVTGVPITLSVPSDFTTEGGSASSISGTTPFTSILTLPNTADVYTITAITIAGYSPASTTVTVTAPTGPGTLTLTLGTRNGNQQTITVSATRGGSPRSGVRFTITGGLTSYSGVTDTTGSISAIITLPSATGSHLLTVSATDYNSAQATALAPGQQGETPPPTGTVGAADSIEIVGQRQLSGTVNRVTALRARVVDANGTGVSNVRVTFRVLAPGRGRLSQRGNGRAVTDQTDGQGIASASLTPLGDGDLIVEARAAQVSAAVTFIIAVGEADDTGTREPDVTPSREISPVVHVGAAQRPPMVWVDGGAIYALVGADVQEFGSGIDNAMNIAVGGGKVYWTEMTGESSGTINSANLDGSGVEELKSLMAVPMGIAVDTDARKLYWTNSRGRIQSLNADGSGSVENVLQNLTSPLDIVLAAGNVYWTHSNGGVGFMNLTGPQETRNISNGADAAGSLVISGGKVYWTEMLEGGGGTVNSANLDGTDVTQLASILAAPSGIAVDGSRSKLYWTNSRGRIQSANLDGSKIQNVVDGLGGPGDMVLSNSIVAPTAGETASESGTTASKKYDVNGDDVVDGKDKVLVLDAIMAGTYIATYDVNDDKKLDILDYVLVDVNIDAGTAGAPGLLGMKLTAVEIDRLQAQIDLLIATGDRSPAAMRTLIYLQQLLVMARPEQTQLLANYPNPFNPETWIPYQLATDTTVKITIYNTQGVVIRTLELGHQSAGYYTGRDRAAYWDGRNAFGEQVASGIYFYQFETDDMSSMRKMVILK